VCEVQFPPVRHLPKGTAVRCHRTEAELLAAQTNPIPAPPGASPNNPLYERTE